MGDRKLNRGCLVKASVTFLFLQITTIAQPYTAQATLIIYEFNFLSSFGPQPFGEFTYNNTPGDEEFTQFFIDVNHEERLAV